MITDNQTNYVYLADTLEKHYPKFYKNLIRLFNKNNIQFGILKGTKDIWVTDYMPVQITNNDFVRFAYKPDYLKTSAELETITDVNLVCKNIALKARKYRLVVDGGNITRSDNKVIMCDKVFTDNKRIQPSKLITLLYDYLKVDKIIFIPTHPHDFTGHSDGIVRFINEDTVLVNDYARERNSYKLKLHLALHNAGLSICKLIYNPYDNYDYSQAIGEYINYLHIGGNIIVPIFDTKDDEVALCQMARLFPNKNIIPINCVDIGLKGGLLNCICWNIFNK